jgi:hypothetical protein
MSVPATPVHVSVVPPEAVLGELDGLADGPALAD